MRTLFYLVFLLLALPNAYALDLSGNLSGTIPLTGSPHTLVGDVVIPAGQTLTIEPGVTVRISSAAQFTVNGTLLAVGAINQPIIFTSARPTSNRGDWRTIRFNGAGSSGSRLDRVVIRYGGAASVAALDIFNSSMTVANSEISQSISSGIQITGDQGPQLLNNQIQDNASSGIFVTGPVGAPMPHCVIRGNGIRRNATGIFSTSPIEEISQNIIASNTSAGLLLPGQSVLRDNTLDANGVAIGFSGAGVPVLTGNAFRNQRDRLITIQPNIFPQDGGGNSFETNNALNGIFILGSTWTVSGTLHLAGLPYVFLLETNAIGLGATVSLAPGVILKFHPLPFATVPRLNVLGGLQAVGTASQPIFFTSSRDDSVGGNTFPAEGPVSPSAGDWGGVHFLSSEIGSRLQHVHVRYGGGTAEMANIRIFSSSVTLMECDISSSNAHGVLIQNSNPTILQNRIHHNLQNGIRTLTRSRPEIHFNDIYANSLFGITNADSNVTVSAQNNYWGSLTGPRHATNSSGTGDAVSDFVNFTPFLAVSAFTAAPGPPVQLHASLGGEAGDLRLNWQPHPEGTAAAAYTIYRSSTPIISASPTTILASGITATSLVDFPSPDIPAFYYAVSGTGATGAEGPVSGSIRVDMPLTPVLTASPESFPRPPGVFTFEGYAQAATRIEVSTGSGGTDIVLSSAMTGTDRRFIVDVPLTNPGVHSLQIKARSTITLQVSSAAIRTITVQGVLAPPGEIQAIPGDTVVQLSWTADPTASGYRIYRNGNSRPLHSQPLPPEQTLYRDTGLINRKRYHYRISILRDGFESPLSPPVEVVPLPGPEWEAP